MYAGVSESLCCFKTQLRKSQGELVAEGASLGGVTGFGEAASNACEDLPRAIRATNSLDRARSCPRATLSPAELRQRPRGGAGGPGAELGMGWGWGWGWGRPCLLLLPRAQPPELAAPQGPRARLLAHLLAMHTPPRTVPKPPTPLRAAPLPAKSRGVVPIPLTQGPFSVGRGGCWQLGAQGTKGPLDASHGPKGFCQPGWDPGWEHHSTASQHCSWRE